VKTDESGQNRLKDAEFKVTSSDERDWGTKKTDENGEAVFDNLEWGLTYTVEEVTPPAGYEFGTIEPTDTVELTAEQLTFTVTAKNPKKTGTITVIKTDESGNVRLPGAEFILQSGNDTWGPVTTNQDGIAEFTGLEWGRTYKVVETKAPEGYDIGAVEPEEVTLAADYLTAVVYAKNPKILGSLTIKKVEAGTDTGLKGAKFMVTGPNNYERTDLITNDDGVIELTGLETGEYTVTEVEAPE